MDHVQTNGQSTMVLTDLRLHSPSVLPSQCKSQQLPVNTSINNLSLIHVQRR
uniref:Uncharacterized protein n=1 Tax=Anguilla anguilla TaxID=7936 RepID=A0A0E9RAT7_ANGAN